MKKLFSILIIIFAIGCSSKPKAPTPLSPEDLRIKALLSDVNTKVHKDYSKKNKGNFTNFDEAAYQAQLKKVKGASAKEMTEILPLFKTKEFIATKNTYVFCGFAPRLRIAFCDDATCPGTEFFEITDSADLIGKWKSELPLKSCKKSL